MPVPVLMFCDEDKQLYTQTIHDSGRLINATHPQKYRINLLRLHFG